jgi:hypothetical protein
MANTVTIKYQKRGVNFKTTVFQIALTGSYAGPEVVTLTSAASNPGATTADGPAGTAKLPPRITSISGTALVGISGGQLVPTGTPGQYNLTLYNGATSAPISGAYSNSPVLIVEVDHDMQGL